MDCSLHALTNILNNENMQSAINNNLFKRLNHIADQLYEVELVKPENENRERIILGFVFCSMLNRENWIFNSISSKSFETLTSMRNMKWTQTPSTWLFGRKFL